MNGDEPQVEEVFEDELRIITEYEDEILENRDELISVFDSTVSTNMRFNNLDKTVDGLQIALTPEVLEDDWDDFVNAFFTLIINYSPEFRDVLEETSSNEQLVSFFSNLKIDYGLDLERRVFRMWRGQDWWSNIQTNIGRRSNKVYFQHEMTVDYERQFYFNSNLESTLLLINHLAQQIHSAKNQLGEDILSKLPLEQVENAEEELSNLVEDIEEYYDEIEEESEEYDEPEKEDDDEGSESGEKEEKSEMSETNGE